MGPWGGVEISDALLGRKWPTAAAAVAVAAHSGAPLIRWSVTTRPKEFNNQIKSKLLYCTQQVFSAAAAATLNPCVVVPTSLALIILTRALMICRIHTVAALVVGSSSEAPQPERRR